MAWIKISDGIWADETDNPQSVVTAEELNTELNEINTSITNTELLPDEITVPNDEKIYELERLNSRKDEIEFILSIE